MLSVPRLTLEVVPIDTWAWPDHPTLLLRTCPSVPWAASALRIGGDTSWPFHAGLPAGNPGCKTPRSRGGWTRSLKQRPAEQHTPSRTHAYYFHCETWKVVWAALCQQKPAWDTVLSYYFRDLCKRLSKHGGKFFLLEEYILTEAELTNKNSR